ncbi:MAG: YceI family protein [Bacteroidota bacterium]|nr:YceI family protein [Chitinophagaceae bacterium]MDZ4810261.1 YceI family protein [Bacteroidota bacterium]
MKKTILFFSLIIFAGGVMAQKVTTTSAVIGFDATTPKDALPKAENKAGIASLDKTTGVIMFEAAVNNFAFSNPKIQEHFNGAAWLNSAAFPKFTFTGKIDKLNKIKFNKNGVYDVTVSGNLTVKGISKPVSAKAKVTVTGTAVSAVSTLSIKLADYGITGQSIEAGKVATEPKVTVSVSFL